jgi:hypothetical protein
MGEVNEEAIKAKKLELDLAIAAGLFDRVPAIAAMLALLSKPKKSGFFDGCKFTALELMQGDRPPPRQWTGRLIGPSGQAGVGLLPRGEVGLLAGSAGGGKSMLAVGLAIGIASGTPALDVVECTRGRALIVSTEDEADELYRRIYAYIDRTAQANDGIEDLNDVLGRIDCLVRPKGVDWSLVDSAGRPTAAYEALNEIVQVGEYALVVLDTLSRLGNDEIEKSPTASRKFVELLEKMTAAPSKPTVLMLHHMRKAENNSKRKSGDETEDDLTADSIRGTSGLVGGVRFAIIAQPQDAVIRLILAKSNYGPRTSINLRKGDHGVIWGRAT